MLLLYIAETLKKEAVDVSIDSADIPAVKGPLDKCTTKLFARERYNISRTRVR